jgi:hypothetical protein
LAICAGISITRAFFQPLGFAIDLAASDAVFPSLQGTFDIALAFTAAVSIGTKGGTAFVETLVIARLLTSGEAGYTAHGFSFTGRIASALLASASGVVDGWGGETGARRKK